MAHTLVYNADTDCIELTVEGTFTMERLKRIAPEVATLSAQSGCLNILNDMSGATIDISLSEAYASPQEMDSSGILRTTRRALVVPEDFAQGGFLETVTRNRGHNLKVFHDRQSALQWLQQKSR
jgi:hypothetical protein